MASTLKEFQRTISINTLKPFMGWVLDGLFRDAGSSVHQELAWNVFSRKRSDFLDPWVIKSSLFPTRCELAFFTHHETFLKESHRKIYDKSEKRLYVTHLNESSTLSKSDFEEFSSANVLFAQNASMRTLLINAGIPGDKIRIAHGGVDRDIYFPVTRREEDSYILISGYFKYRKNPSLVAEVIRSLPELNFVVHGRFKEEFPTRFFESVPNVKWLEFDIARQPKLVQSAEMYLSLSRIEGGPIGILEALACGVPVVATDTGFASDLLTESNGRLVSSLPTVAEVAQAIHEVRIRFQGQPRIDLLDGRYTFPDLAATFFN